MVKYQPAQAQFPALAWAGWGTLWGCEAGAAGGGRGGGDLFGAGILVLLQLAHRPDHRHHLRGGGGGGAGAREREGARLQRDMPARE